MEKSETDINYYIKLPNRLFYKSKTDTEDSILSQVKNDKVLLVMDYLYTSVNRRNLIKFTLEDIIVDCGFKPNKRPSKKSKNLNITKKSKNSNEQFIYILSQLQKLNIIHIFDKNINSSFLVETIKPKQLLRCTLNINLEQGFTLLFDSEKAKINTQIIDKVDNYKLLIYYCYLKCRMYKRKIGDDRACHGGRSEVTWVSFKKINDDLGLANESISKYNDILTKINLIRIDNAGTWYYTDDKYMITRESSNIYTLYKDNEEYWKEDLKEGIKGYKGLLMNANKTFTGTREYKNNNHKLNGELGSLIKKRDSVNPTATPENIARITEIQYLQSDNVKNSYRLKSYLSINEKDCMLLSNYYANNCDDEKASYYEDLEHALGLTDIDCNILVDWSYYVKIISEYEEKDFDLIVNVVKKYKRNHSIWIEFIDGKPTIHLGRSKEKFQGTDVVSEEEYINNSYEYYEPDEDEISDDERDYEEEQQQKAQDMYEQNQQWNQ